MILGDEVAAIGLRGHVRLADVLFAAEKACRIAPTQIVRADRVVGFPHVEAAARHARRADKEGRMQARTIEVEFTRYLAGQRQIRVALETVGLPASHDDVVVVALGPRAADAARLAAHVLSLPEDDALIEATPDKVAAFVTKEARDATPPALHDDLVLERVAEVDLLR